MTPKQPPLTTIVGRRAPPARGHVVLVGFGQVGFRLSQALRGRGIPVTAVERDPDAPYVRHGQRARIPVVIGRGDDRATLELVGAGRCAVVAAVTSDDLVNVAVGLAAGDVHPGVPLALRLGDGGVATETESLLHLGTVFDAHHLGATTLADAICAKAFDLGTDSCHGEMPTHKYRDRVPDPEAAEEQPTSPRLGA